jgi:membrane protein
VLLLLTAVALVYWAGPNANVPFRIFTPGALLAVAVWIGASSGFAYYVANFASYNKTYGRHGRRRRSAALLLHLGGRGSWAPS